MKIDVLFGYNHPMYGADISIGGARHHAEDYELSALMQKVGTIMQPHLLKKWADEPVVTTCDNSATVSTA